MREWEEGISMGRLSIVVTVFLAVAGLLVPGGQALAQPGTQVLDITYKVKNAEDSGLLGYWALDNYTKEVQAWQVAPGKFTFEVRYVGTWRTL
jgi:hypothetical protein